jgi:hypothetical protein
MVPLRHALQFVGGHAAGAAKEGQMTPESILESHRDRLLAVPGVVGVGLGLQSGQKVIVVMTERPAREVKGRLPAQIEGTTVVIQETGPVRAY